jgi:hypothetical protein
MDISRKLHDSEALTKKEGVSNNSFTEGYIVLSFQFLGVR